VAFEVYPATQTTPLNIAASGSSALSAITELVGVDPTTGLHMMFIRVVKLGADCAASGPPHPTARLKADTGDPVPLSVDSTTVSIFNQPGGTGTEVANATLEVEGDDVYLVRVFVFQSGSSWQIQIVNNDTDNAHDFTWVVADTDAHARQPWIDVPTTLAYDVFTGQAKTHSLQVANRGTGPLTIGDAPGFSPGPGFVIGTVPGAVNPNACANLEITFTGPGTPGASEAIYTVTSDDTTAQLAAGHNRRVILQATTINLRAQKVTGSWSGIPSPTTKDWVGLYPAGTLEDTKYLTWEYTDGGANGTRSLTIPAGAAPGTYELRLFSNNGYTRLAASDFVQIIFDARLTASPSTIRPGDQVTASWSGIPSPTATDWVGLYAVGTLEDRKYLTWKYTDGGASGTRLLPIPAGVAPGTYELRLFSNNGYTRLAASARINVAAAASLTGTTAGGLTSSWRGIPNPTATDWVGLYLIGVLDDTKYLTWKYTDGGASGTRSLPIPAGVAPGNSACSATTDTPAWQRVTS
jgi:hypothetical protein